MPEVADYKTRACDGGEKIKLGARKMVVRLGAVISGNDAGSIWKPRCEKRDAWICEMHQASRVLARKLQFC